MFRNAEPEYTLASARAVGERLLWLAAMAVHIGNGLGSFMGSADKPPAESVPDVMYFACGGSYRDTIQISLSAISAPLMNQVRQERRDTSLRSGLHRFAAAALLDWECTLVDQAPLSTSLSRMVDIGELRGLFCDRARDADGCHRSWSRSAQQWSPPTCK